MRKSDFPLYSRIYTIFLRMLKITLKNVPLKYFFLYLCELVVSILIGLMRPGWLSLTGLFVAALRTTDLVISENSIVALIKVDFNQLQHFWKERPVKRFPFKTRMKISFHKPWNCQFSEKSVGDIILIIRENPQKPPKSLCLRSYVAIESWQSRSCGQLSAVMDLKS